MRKSKLREKLDSQERGKMSAHCIEKMKSGFDHTPCTYWQCECKCHTREEKATVNETE